MVEKKKTYPLLYLFITPNPPSLGFVGSGALESSLQQQARSLDLRVISGYGTIYSYGFRQIEENAPFYTLADAFVLPSLRVEWGLVVNEAMAYSIPVIVSNNAGCAEDLLPCESSQGLVHHPSSQLQQRSNGFVF